MNYDMTYDCDAPVEYEDRRSATAKPPRTKSSGSPTSDPRKPPRPKKGKKPGKLNGAADDDSQDQKPGQSKKPKRRDEETAFEARRLQRRAELRRADGSPLSEAELFRPEPFRYVADVPASSPLNPRLYEQVERSRAESVRALTQGVAPKSGGTKPPKGTDQGQKGEGQVPGQLSQPHQDAGFGLGLCTVCKQPHVSGPAYSPGGGIHLPKFAK